MTLLQFLIIELMGDKCHRMTLLGALIIQLKFVLIMIIIFLIQAKFQKKTLKEFMNLGNYPPEHNLILFGFMFVLWFGVITYYRYIFQLPLMGVTGYLW